MSLISFVQIGSLLLILCNSGEAIVCPSTYHSIANGCYKIINGLTRSWADARQYCLNESLNLPINEIVPNAITHLVALELAMEKKRLVLWMEAYFLKTEFWIDGIVSTSSWNWSNQSITWYFDANERAVIGYRSNYKFAYNSSSSIYQIADEVYDKTLNYICEYQIQCNGGTECQNNATCYLNIGHELCVCAAGFTGQYCEIEIIECLSSPCLHGGICIDGINNYTCDCSNIYYTGSNCEIPLTDPTQNQRSAAFWSVFGVVTGLIIILILSDFPWYNILTTIGCLDHYLICCSKKNHDQDIKENHLHSPKSSTDNYNFAVNNKPISVISKSKGSNHSVMDVVWNPEYIRNQTSINSQYNIYPSLDQKTTPDNMLIQSFVATIMAKQKEKELEDKRIYAVNINESTSKTNDPVDTMINWTQQLQNELRSKKS